MLPAHGGAEHIAHDSLRVAFGDGTGNDVSFLFVRYPSWLARVVSVRAFAQSSGFAVADLPSSNQMKGVRTHIMADVFQKSSPADSGRLLGPTPLPVVPVHNQNGVGRLALRIVLRASAVKSPVMEMQFPAMFRQIKFEITNL